MHRPPHPAIALLGPTGSGKTDLSIALAGRFQGEIVSCDAFQVYRHMDVGTAKATPEQQAAVAHHMIDLREPDEDFSAGDYKRLARRALRAIRRRGKIPFVVGGTGFYFRALTEGLFRGPGRSEELRARIREVLRRKGAAHLYRILRRADPPSAERLAAADSERIIRALEVRLLTGKPISWWQRQPRDRLEGFRWLKLGIARPRRELHERIDRRVGEMFEEGFLEEVRGLLERYPRDSHAFKAIGYRQIADHLAGVLTLEEAVEETRLQSRRYAKRQMTWFRSEPGIVWLDFASGGGLVEQAAGLVADFLEKEAV